MVNDKMVLDLTKALELNLEKEDFPEIKPMAVKLAVDCSSSMGGMFYTGMVDHLVARFFAAAMKFDDNHTLDIGGFNTCFKVFPSISSLPDGRYTEAYGMKPGGGTCFAPVIQDFAHLTVDISKPVQTAEGLWAKAKGFFNRAKNAVETGTLDLSEADHSYLGFLTDGDAGDWNDFENILQQVASNKTFIQIIAIGSDVNVSYLHRIAGQHPNVSVIHFPEPLKVTDLEFYAAICNPKFKDWLINTRG